MDFVITGQYCGRLLKFSAHSLNVLGIRYKVFKYVFLLIISYIHIYKTIFQICFFIDDIIYTYIQDHIEMQLVEITQICLIRGAMCSFSRLGHLAGKMHPF